MPDFVLIGGIALNRPVGGINPAAVERMASMKGKPGRVVVSGRRDSELVVPAHWTLNRSLLGLCTVW